MMLLAALAALAALSERRIRKESIEFMAPLADALLDLSSEIDCMGSSGLMGVKYLHLLKECCDEGLILENPIRPLAAGSKVSFDGEVGIVIFDDGGPRIEVRQGSLKYQWWWKVGDVECEVLT